MGGKLSLALSPFPADKSDLHSLGLGPAQEAIALPVRYWGSIRRLPAEGEGPILGYSPGNVVWRDAASLHRASRLGDRRGFVRQHQPQEVAAAEAQTTDE